ncbi:MAG: 4-hydroxyphenylpyruvate dioxygenase [Phototrophicales bacterium]|nr:MAG: 4-hydroxyphenylpyruvate dioxygenase [Phototrophicales bacterium]
MVIQDSVDARPITQEADFLRLKAFDHVELWVGNAKQAAYFYQHAFGFTPIAYSGLETGNRKFASYVLQQGKIRLVVTAPYHPNTEISAHHLVHGDGVKAIGLEVFDAAEAYEVTTSRGARGVHEAMTLSDDFGQVSISAIETYGDTIHRFVERSGYEGPFWPGYEPIGDGKPRKTVGLAAIDHIVGNVELGKMNYWVKFYHQTMGFRQLIHFDDAAISTEYSALMSKVMENGNGRIKFPINEPAEGRKRSQIEEYLDFYHGPGVQHIAMLTDDIIHTVAELRDRGVEFLTPPPDAYYDEVIIQRLQEKNVKVKEDLEAIRKLGILLDADDEGYLLQIFTRPVGDRPTLFFEIIQRRGSRGFGAGNFKALFESIEREQAKRGTL